MQHAIRDFSPIREVPVGMSTFNTGARLVPGVAAMHQRVPLGDVPIENAQISPRRKSTSPAFDNYVNRLIDTHLDMGHPQQFITQKVSRELYHHKLNQKGRRQQSNSPAFSRSSLPLATSQGYRVDDPPALDRPRNMVGVSSVAHQSGISHDAVGNILDAQIDRWSAPGSVPQGKSFDNTLQSSFDFVQDRFSEVEKQSMHPSSRMSLALGGDEGGFPESQQLHSQHQSHHQPQLHSQHQSHHQLQQHSQQQGQPQQGQQHQQQQQQQGQPETELASHASSLQQPHGGRRVSGLPEDGRDNNNNNNNTTNSNNPNNPNNNNNNSYNPNGATANTNPNNTNPSASASASARPGSPNKSLFDDLPAHPSAVSQHTAAPAPSMVSASLGQTQKSDRPNPYVSHNSRRSSGTEGVEDGGGGGGLGVTHNTEASEMQAPLPPRNPLNPSSVGGGGGRPAPTLGGSFNTPMAQGGNKVDTMPQRGRQSPPASLASGRNSGLGSSQFPLVNKTLTLSSPPGPNRPISLPQPPVAPVVPGGGRLPPSPGRVSPVPGGMVVPRVSPPPSPLPSPRPGPATPRGAFTFPESSLTVNRIPDGPPAVYRNNPLFTHGTTFSIDDVQSGVPVQNSSKAQWQKERLQHLERKRQAHRMQSNQPMEVQPMQQGVQYPGVQMQMQMHPSMQMHSGAGMQPHPMMYANHIPPPYLTNPPAGFGPYSAYPSYLDSNPVFAARSTAPMMDVPPTSPMLSSGLQLSPRRNLTQNTSGRPVSPRVITSILDQELEMDRKKIRSPFVEDVDTTYMHPLELPNDEMPVIPESQVLRAKTKRFDFLQHPGAPLMLNLLALKGLEYGKNHEDDRLIEAYMTQPLLNASHWMQVGTYMTKYGKDGDPVERYFFIKEVMDPYTGHKVPRFCHAKKSDSISFTTGEALIDLVDVERGIGNEIFTSSRDRNGGDEWIKGVRIGNKRRLVSSRGCFALIFRIPPTAKSTETMYKATGLMSLKPDTFSAWVPAFEAIRSIVNKRMQMPSRNATSQNHFSGQQAAPAQPVRPVTVKIPPGNGFSAGGLQPAAPASIKQAPVEAQSTAERTETLQSGSSGKKALVIAVSYQQDGEVLKNAHTAATTMGNFLRRREGWKDCALHIMQDSSNTNIQSTQYPSKVNMLSEMKWLTSDPNTQTILCYIGHGSQLAGGGTDCLVPADHKTAGVIMQDEVHAALLAGMQPSTRLTCVFDVHKGSGSYLNVPHTLSQRPGQSPQSADSETASNQNVIVVSCSRGDPVPPAALGGIATGFVAGYSRVKDPQAGKVLQAITDVTQRNGFQHAVQISSTKAITQTTPLEL